jgi:hypothetical protein
MNDFPNFFQHVGFNFDGPHMSFPQDQALRFLQIGVYTGDASIYLLEKFSHIKDFVLTDVDTWSVGDSFEMNELDFYEIEKYYLDRTRNQRELGRCKSIKTTSDLFFASNREKFKFIYVDGNHEAIQVLKDGLNAFESLELGGILAFDDYLGATNKHPNERPKIAIDLFLSLLIGKVEIVINNYQLWIRKVSTS